MLWLGGNGLIVLAAPAESVVGLSLGYDERPNEKEGDQKGSGYACNYGDGGGVGVGWKVT